MKTRTIAFIAIAASINLGAVIVACSSDNGSGSSGTLPGVDSGGSDGTSSGSTSSGGDTGASSSSGGDTGASSSSGGQDAGADCKAPPTLHATDGGEGPYCPFLANDAGRNCAVGETCCHANNTDPETCAASATACAVPDGGVTFGCDSPNECTGGQKCCYLAPGTVLTDQTCGTLFASKEHGTQCAATCAAGDLEICAQQSDCTTGTCTPFSGKGHQLGYCKP
jgi:hypothetical protein